MDSLGSSDSFFGWLLRNLQKRSSVFRCEGLFVAHFQHWRFVRFLMHFPICVVETNSNASCRFAWEATVQSGGVFNYYAILKFNCLYQNYFCDETRSNPFRVNVDHTIGYNYNQQTNSATEIIPLYNSTCLDYESTANCDLLGNPVWTQLCNFCKVGGNYSVDLSCTNCYTRATAAVVGFDLDIFFAAVKNFDFYLNGSCTLYQRLVCQQSLSLPLLYFLRS